MMIRMIKNVYHLVLAIAASMWYGFPSQRLTVIGVTGTDGKTTTATLIYEILKAAGRKVSMITSVHAVIGGTSYDTGFHVTTPNAIDIQRYLHAALANGDSHVVLEVTSHALAQHRVWGVRFAVGVITNVTHEHLDWHKTYDSYRNVKLSLLSRAGVAIVNADDEATYAIATGILKNHAVTSYSVRHHADVTPKSFPFTTKLPGEYNQENCLAAIAAAQCLGIRPVSIRKAIAGFRGVPGRMEVVMEDPIRVIVDFAHTPNALEQVLKTVSQTKKKRLIHLFGCAGLRDHQKRAVMGRVSSTYADSIVLTEEDYRTERVETIMDEIADGIAPGKTVFRKPDRGEAVRFALSLARPGDTVILTGKGHERSLCRGTTEYPWSDQDAARRYLKALKKRSSYAA